MSLVLALGLPIAHQVFTTLLARGGLASGSLPVQLLNAFMDNVFKGGDVIDDSLVPLEEGLARGFRQDFNRDYGAALLAMEDATRATTRARYEADLNDAWLRLRAASEGTEDGQAKARAQLVAALVGLQRGEPVNAIARARGSFDTATGVALEATIKYAYTFLRGYKLADKIWNATEINAVLQNERLGYAAEAQAAFRLAEAASRFLGGLQDLGHPVRFGCLQPQQWFASGSGLSQLLPAAPAITVFGHASAKLIQEKGAVVSRLGKDGSASLNWLIEAGTEPSVRDEAALATGMPQSDIRATGGMPQFVFDAPRRVSGSLIQGFRDQALGIGEAHVIRTVREGQGIEFEFNYVLTADRTAVQPPPVEVPKIVRREFSEMYAGQIDWLRRYDRWSPRG
jgi:hypothetical protein